MPKTPLFHKGHYNILAAQIRKWCVPPALMDNDREMAIIVNGVMLGFTKSLAERLAKDNPLFDPVKFLNAASPDSEMYPWGEAWNAHDSGA